MGRASAALWLATIALSPAFAQERAQTVVISIEEAESILPHIKVPSNRAQITRAIADAKHDGRAELLFVIKERP
jgi:hypothetical protein